MAELRSFFLPDVGEGLTEAEIVAWRVAPGDVVVVNQPLIEVETAKAVVELPSPFAGTVVSLAVTAGQLVPVGTELITFAVADDVSASPPSKSSVEVVVHREPVLVGYGVAAETTARRARSRQGEPASSVPTTSVGPVLTTPPVRALAKARGIDLAQVPASGLGGVVTRTDVEAFVQSAHTAAGADVGSGPALVVERIPIRGVLRTMADAMVRSAFTAPHVTEWVTVDVTRSVELLARMREHPKFEGIRVTPLTLIAAGLIYAVRRSPRINGRWEEAAGEIVLPDHIDLGIAAATPRGLLVPHVPCADRLSLPELAQALTQLADTARSGLATPAQLSGGTITITNVGVFGVDGGTPIINPGQAAILCAGRIAPRPWVVNGALEVREVMELSLSFDHRMVDGAIGSQALSDVARFLEDPAVELLLA